jgi:hypothetical protein
MDHECSMRPSMTKVCMGEWSSIVDLCSMGGYGFDFVG